MPAEFKPYLQALDPLFHYRPVWSIHSLVARIQETYPKLTRLALKK